MLLCILPLFILLWLLLMWQQERMLSMRMLSMRMLRNERAVKQASPLEKENMYFITIFTSMIIKQKKTLWKSQASTVDMN